MKLKRPKNKWLFWISIAILLLMIFLLRYPILKLAGKYLIYENDLKPVKVIFVLSGGAFDRGNEAAKLYKENYADKIICTGANIPHDFKVLRLEIPEAELTSRQILNSGVPNSVVDTLSKGTSTREEADVILNYCLKNNLDTIIVLSSKFHTRRIKQVFQDKFEENKIFLIIRGAPSGIFKEEEWWNDEYGLLAVNNEYVKLVYYAIF